MKDPISPTPGLTICLGCIDFQNRKRYEVRHIQSGKLIGAGRDSKAFAIAYAKRVAALADWTQPSETILAIPGIYAAISEAFADTLTLNI